MPAKSLAWAYFEKVNSRVTRACRFHRRRNTLDDLRIRAETGWLRKELQRLLETETHDHDRTRRLQKRLGRYATEWLTFLDRPETPPTNNHAEMLLRSLVILRKITFGNRSEAGARRTARLMTVMTTAKRHGHRALDIYYRMAVDPPDRVLRHLYSGP
ncbi:MAG: transposase [Planctomycetaceae bacterium]